MKEIVNSSMVLDECLASIIFYQTQSEKLLYNLATKIAHVHHEGYDKEMKNVASFVSKHVCELIHEQYVHAIGPASYAYYEAMPGMIVIKKEDDAEESMDEPRA
ncbi:hypothetical protein F442_22617, partial [Phytophthora nicotianae P10297]